MRADLRVLGIDGCKGGWVAVALEGGAVAGVRLAAGIGQLLEDPAVVVGVDIPMGTPATGVRRADAEARRLLPSPLKSSIFNAPPRGALDEPDYAAASARCLALTQKRLSRQSYALGRKMLEVEPHWAAAPERIFEVHPELSFQALSGGSIRHSKHTWNGHGERAAALVEAGIALPTDLVLPGPVAPDDVLDAAAVAWSASRIALGTARSIPAPPELDDGGRHVAIWC
jgi:predicted RNase H-like nuclease